MDDDNWDLHAVVRGYASASPTSAASAANNTVFPSFSTVDQNPSFDFLLTDDGNMNFDPFQGLHDAYRELCGGEVAPPPPASTFSFPAPAAHNVVQPRQEMTQMFMKPPNNYINMNNIEFNSPRFGSTSSHNSPGIHPPPTNNRQRRRKNQQMKLVREMTQEDISADSWAWRKYGQKPIKGSQHPRNYYRCSTSKGCAARKQVERSANDAGLFVVSYTGEHTHPRPTHRSSLAGSTRSKLSSPRTSAMKNNNINNNNKGNLNISSSSSAFTPTTPVAADVEMSEEMDDGEDENIFMIPNDDEDLFKVFHDSDDGSGGGGGDLFPGGMLASPPWSPAGSATFRG